MTMSSPGGWLDRRKKTTEKQTARADMASIRAERARMASEKAAKDEAQTAANAAAISATKCSCPVCDTGIITVELAERVYRALQKLPSDSRPDPDILASLARIAQGQANHGYTPKVALGLAHPRAVETAATTPAQVKKSSKINRFTDDGALIELDD